MWMEQEGRDFTGGGGAAAAGHALEVAHVDGGCGIFREDDG